jgi:hypothetical protein
MPAADLSFPPRALPLVAFKCTTAQKCGLWSLQPYHQCTNMCTLATSTLPFSAQICVLWPLQQYLSVHKYVYFGHLNRTFQCTNMCTLATSTVPFSAQICVLRPLKVNSKAKRTSYPLNTRMVVHQRQSGSGIEPKLLSRASSTSR